MPLSVDLFCKEGSATPSGFVSADVSFLCQNCVVSPEFWYPALGTSHPASFPASLSSSSSFSPCFLLSFFHFPCSHYSLLPTICVFYVSPSCTVSLFPTYLQWPFSSTLSPSSLAFHVISVISECFWHLHFMASSLLLSVLLFGFDFSPLCVSSLASNLSSDLPKLSWAWERAVMSQCPWIG